MSLIIKLDETRYRCEHRLVRNKKDGSVLVLVPGGEFEMGDGAEANCPKHRVKVDAYWIGVYCVTKGQWAAFKGSGGVEAGKNAHPVVDVNWDDAMGYAKWAGCELPTEAQWEKAARGPSGLIYPWGNDWDAGKCRNDTNKGSEQTAPVWGYPAGVSGYGTYQQSGNVLEWCRDWYGENYYKEAGAMSNPTGPATGSCRVDRGGGWDNDDASNFRGAIRWDDPANRNGYRGFRLVRAVPSLPSARK